MANVCFASHFDHNLLCNLLALQTIPFLAHEPKLAATLPTLADYPIRYQSKYGHRFLVQSEQTLSRSIFYKLHPNHDRLCTHHRMQGTYQLHVGNACKCIQVPPFESGSPTHFRGIHALHASRFLGWLSPLEQSLQPLSSGVSLMLVTKWHT